VRKEIYIACDSLWALLMTQREVKFECKNGVQADDGYVHFGDVLQLVNAGTEAALSIDVEDRVCTSPSHTQRAPNIAHPSRRSPHRLVCKRAGFADLLLLILTRDSNLCTNRDLGGQECRAYDSNLLHSRPVLL
jgi:hypothetical protein